MKGITIQLSVVFILSCMGAVAQVKPNTSDFPAATTQTVNIVPPAYSGPVSFMRTWTAQKPLAIAGEIISGSRTLQEVQLVTQYVDGLGRPLQTVAKGVSPAGYDMVTPILYDDYGRVTFSYLPYTSTGTNGSFKTSPFSEQATFMQGMYNPTSNANGEKFFYGRTAYEPSPLNRPDSAFAAGNSWVGRASGVNLKYDVNVTSDSVRLWTIGSTGTIPNSSQVYSEAQLIKLITIDEHGKYAIEFKDRKGRVILKKVQVAGSLPSTPYVGWLCVYYVYDYWDNLRYVIQPLGVELTRANNWSISAAIAKELCFVYEYDNKNRMISKRVPGSGEVWMVYDKRNRLIMTQDSLLRAKGKWIYNRYDSLNRQILNGLWTISGDRVFHQLRGDTSVIYPNPSSNNEVLVETYYDNYSWVSGSGSGLSSTLITTYTSNSNYFYTSYSSYPYPQAIATGKVTSGLVTGTKVKALGTSTYLYSVSFYDDRGKVIQIHSTNFGNGKDTVTNQYDFSGRLLRSLLCHAKNTPNAQRYQVLTKTEYDAQGRLTKISKKTGSSPEVVLTENSYNELGQLQKKKVGRNRDEISQNTYTGNAIDSLQYVYNIRGWLRGINKDYARVTGGANNYFGLELTYDFGFTQTQLNGNIAGTRWRSKGDGEKRAYGFTYDAANRFTKGDFTQDAAGIWNTSAGVDFTVKDMSYDANGNILSMTQSGIKLNTSSVIDSLTYGYMSTNTTNKLLYVTDKTNDSTSKLGDFKEYANNTTQDYWYDGNGNLTKDSNKRINTITYNHLNLPDTIHVLGKGRIFYTYDATGIKLKKQTVDSTINPVKTITTLYLDEFIYENDTLQSVTTEEGRARPKRAGYSDTLYYDYFIKDHLGNVHMVLTDEIQRDQYPSVTFEVVNQLTEQLYYEKANDQHTLRPAAFFNNGSNGDTVQLLRKSVQSVGVGKLLKVMATDSLHVRVDYYTPNVTADNTSANGINSVITVLAQLLNTASAPLPVHGNGVVLTNALNSSADFTTFLSGQSGSGGSYPKAYLNILFFDEQFKFVQQNSEVKPITVKGNGAYLECIGVNAKIAPKNGYAYIYISNESNNLVYFDNLQITHRRGKISEENHYYPYGLTLNGISSKAINYGKTFKDKFNSIEHNTDFDINMYDALYRNLDPQTGRFLQLDPRPNELFSPYAAMGNNPVLFSDPLGDTTWVVGNKGNLLGVVNDNLENQVHYLNDGGGGSKFDASTLTPEGALELAKSFRAQSVAFIGSNTVAQMRQIAKASEDKKRKHELGFIATVGPTKELILTQLPDKYRKDDNQYDLHAALKDLFTEEQQARIFAVGHTHLKKEGDDVTGYAGYTGTMAKFLTVNTPSVTNQGERTYPDYQPFLYRYDPTTKTYSKGRSPALLISVYGLTIYGTGTGYNKNLSVMYPILPDKFDGYILYKKLIKK